MTPSINRREIGQSEENRAKEYLLAKGWKFIHANFSTRWGEVDLIFKDNSSSVVFVEVKFRASTNFIDPIYSINRAKQNRIIRAAVSFIKSRSLSGANFRFDVIIIRPTGIEHIPNAFTARNLTL